MSTHASQRIWDEIDALPREEFQAAFRRIEESPGFPGWNACPFGGWSLCILKVVYEMRRENAADTPIIVEVVT